jgi:hypothetical protein
MRAVLVFLALMLMPMAALADDIEQIDTPSGVTVDYVKCKRSPNKCMNAAAEYCKGSYQIIGSESHPGMIMSDMFAGAVTWYSMTFLCGVSDGQMPNFPYQKKADPPSTVLPPGVSAVCKAIGRGKSCIVQ